MTPRRSALLAAALVALALVAALVAGRATRTTGDVNRLLGAPGAQGAAAVLPASQGQPIPSLAPATGWDNSPPLSDASLRGKVVLVDFWDASCINCRRTFAFLRRLQTTYAAQGLVIVGVHSPEFGFEKVHRYVAQQVTELGVTWPVAEDPQMAIWNEFSNQYWPAEYLVDRHGLVRYRHDGEGDEQQIEGALRTLLAEGGSAGAAVVGPVPQSAQAPQPGQTVTPETYLGTTHGLDLGDTVLFSAAVSRQPEYVTVPAGASITLHFQARDVYVVLDPGPTGRTVRASVTGAAPGPDVGPGGTVTVARQDLYHVVTGSVVGVGTLVLTAVDGPVLAYSFTFGG